MSEQRADNVAEIATPPAKHRYFKYLVHEEGCNPDVLEKNSGINKRIFVGAITCLIVIMTLRTGTMT